MGFCKWVSNWHDWGCYMAYKGYRQTKLTNTLTIQVWGLGARSHKPENAGVASWAVWI